MRPTRGILLVGTDTGVGKTSLAVGLLRLAQRRAFRLVPYKPIETGFVPGHSDAERLCAAANLPDLTAADVGPLRFSAPLAPSIAARLDGVPISPATLERQASALRAQGDSLLVESAGGVLTPYGPDLTSVSLATLFDIDILLVTANRLGTINQTALALSELRRRPIRLAGLVLVQVSAASSPDQDYNGAEIARTTGVSPLGTLRHCARGDANTLADAVAADISLGELFNGALL